MPNQTDELGRLEQAGHRWQLHYTRTLRHPRDKVWRALTEPEHLAAWFPAKIHGERAAGAELRFEFEHGEGPTIEGEMLVYEPPSRLEFRWGVELLRFDLVEREAGTVLTFVNTFDDLGKAARDGAGWHACLDVLEYEIAGEKPPWNSNERWSQVHPRYVETFGPEAATIGPPG
jgi:uncharacterized protein YndB with AHSA1/START domain